MFIVKSRELDITRKIHFLFLQNIFMVTNTSYNSSKSRLTTGLYRADDRADDRPGQSRQTYFFW